MYILVKIKHHFVLDLFFKDADMGSVIVVVGFRSFHAVTRLIEDKRNGRLHRYFFPVQEVLRELPGNDGMTLTVDILFKDYVAFLKDIGSDYFALNVMKQHKKKLSRYGVV